ncbi:MAG TPA: diadenylate cyclase [Bryobacteraceae bacterium]|nr:diadenylate cyclase [Bryobacteraceae bacterium]
MIPLILVRWQNAVDFVVLTVALYILLRWAQQARALRVALVVLGLHVAALVSRHFDLVLTSWVLDGAAILAIVMLLLVFQAELRRFFMRLDSLLNWRPPSASQLCMTCQSISRAAFHMASAYVGALIVIVRQNSVNEIVTDGINLDASVSSEVLEAIFQKTSPVHDGAVVIRGDRIVRAAAVLPLTERDRVPSYYGTRHRAAMGLSERCDALIVVVSEERGEVTLMEAKRMTVVDNPQKLAQTLETLSAQPAVGVRHKLRKWLFSNMRVKLAAVGLAAAIWSTSFVSTGTTIRTVSVPLQFVGVPAGMDVLTVPATDALEVQVRGSAWLMDSVSLTRLVANFNLRGAKPGILNLPVDAGNVNLPPGIVIERVNPPRITVRLTPHKH